MNQYHHLLFATDLSKPNRNIINKIFELSLLYKARLSVIHVIDSPFVSNDEHSVVRNRLNVFCQPLRIPEYDQFIKSGEPHKVIVETSKNVNADLLIIGKKKNNTLTKQLLPITSCELLILQPIP